MDLDPQQLIFGQDAIQFNHSDFVNPIDVSDALTNWIIITCTTRWTL
jgi:hypothetical protein